MSYRHFDSHIRSLIHFDYPYYAEPNDGLTDEILGNVWSRKGNVRLAGSQAPADEILSGTPKYGYRCLRSTSSTDYIACANTTFTMNSTSDYEYSMHIRPSAAQAGTFLLLLNGSTQQLSASIDSTLHVQLNSSALGVSLTSAKTLSVNAWSYVVLRITNGAARIIIDGTEASQTYTTRTALTVTECRLGGINGCIDEFCYRDSLSDAINAVLHQGRINVNDLGGFGSGSMGNVTITKNCVMNSCGWLKYTRGSMIIGTHTTYTLQNSRTGTYGTFGSGQEVLIIPSDGAYKFRQITSLTGSTLAFNSAPTVSGQIVVLPTFNTLTINSGVTVSPYQHDGSSGGIVAFRVKGDCTINGSIITTGTGPARTDNMQLTHSKLIDNLIVGTGGLIMIFCGGTLTIGANARLGATWSGDLGPGAPAARARGGNAGSGYGGAGGSDTDNGGSGGSGGVGGGGGGGDGARAGAAGQAGVDGAQRGAAGTGGGGAAHGSSASAGGTQGLGVNSASAGWASGGGGAGGSSGACTGFALQGASSGANVILIARTLKVDSAAISTGGEGGYYSNVATGGGGTGFCYIACENIA